MATRIAAALVLGPLVLLAFYLGSPFADLLVTLGVAVAAWEWVRICQDGEVTAAGWTAVGLVPAAVAVSRIGTPWQALLVCLIGALVAAALAGRDRRQVALVLAGPLYLVAAGVSILWIRDGPGGNAAAGLTLLFWLLLTVWATDTFAYFVGRSLGGPKLAPRLSPKKTWSGLAGGVLAAAAVGVVFAYVLDSAKSWALPAVAGAVLALLAQAGDLMESGLKRRFGVKDSSNLIPGHGGVLDRIDGLIPASIAVAILIWLGEAPF